MYDSVTARDIPLSARMVAGYVDGTYTWTAADWARFPHAVHVTISAIGRVNAHVLDVERGDATPDFAPGWVRRRRGVGADPTIYCNASTWPAVRAAFRAQGVAEPHYWIALWDGRAQPVSGAVAKQYADPPASGGHYDLSIVADYWGGVDPKPPPPAPVPAPKPAPPPVPAPPPPVPPVVPPVPPPVVPPDPPAVTVTTYTPSFWARLVELLLRLLGH